MESAVMDVNEYFPESPEFKLASTGKTYRFRIPNLQDKMRLRALMPEEQMNQAFKNKEWSTICRYIYALLEDKSDFAAREEDSYDDDGNKTRVLVTGPIVLLRAIKTVEEAVGMLQAFNAASIASEPLLRGPIMDEVKKNDSRSGSAESRTDWWELIELAASAWGLRADEFWRLTSRQLMGLLDALGRREHNDYAKEASLHGIKVPLKTSPVYEAVRQAAQDTPINRDLHDRALREAQERVQERVRKRNGQ